TSLPSGSADPRLCRGAASRYNFQSDYLDNTLVDRNMSRSYLENYPRPTADRLLVLLKTRGPQTAADLGSAVGVTAEAARQQLVRLAADGLVAATSEPRGVGRFRRGRDQS